MGIGPLTSNKGQNPRPVKDVLDTLVIRECLPERRCLGIQKLPCRKRLHHRNTHAFPDAPLIKGPEPIPRILILSFVRWFILYSINMSPCTI